MNKITIDEILGKKNIKEALNHIESKGVNKNKFNDLKEYLELNLIELKKEIQEEVYCVEKIQIKKIVNPNGKTRLVAILNLKDKLICRAISQILNKYLDATFSPNSFAYRPNKGTLAAVKRIQEIGNAGYHFTCKIDIESYFDQINHEKLLEKVKSIPMDKGLYSLIEKYIKCEVSYDFIEYKNSKGIIQGNPISSILSNIYLDALDQKMDALEIKYIRYCDDICIFGKKTRDLQQIKVMLEQELATFGLKFKKEKTISSNIFSIPFFGYKLKRTIIGMEIIKITKEKEGYFENWTQSFDKNNPKEHHIVNNGILGQRDFTLLFENPKKRIYLPVESIDNLNIYASVLLKSNFFQLMSAKGILVHFFNKHNCYLGKFVPNDLKKSSILYLKQADIYNHEGKRLQLAKEIILGGIYNMKSNLKYYDQRYHLNLKEMIYKIENLEKKIKEVSKHNQVLICEAQIRMLYYQSFNAIIDDGNFKFTKRTKRPPQDYLNCLISFGNTLLYNFIAKEIYKTKLDIRIAYLHASNQRYESLNLDLSEIFKPIIIDKIIFKLINKKMIPTYCFEKVGKGIFLNDKGRKIVIKEFYNKLFDKLIVKEERMTYAQIIRKEIAKFVSCILKERKFKPFKYYP